MKIFAVIGLAVVMLLAMSCSTDKPTAPANDSTLNFDVIGSDAPANVDAALQEFSDLSILVPDPVRADDPVLNQELDSETAPNIINAATLDDSARVYFRRIVAHLHDQMNALRRCMANNDDPRLRRLAHGAFQAIQHGLRALQNGEPRMALRYFHTANRALNLANALCRGRG
jgi:hypothetical protein